MNLEQFSVLDSHIRMLERSRKKYRGKQGHTNNNAKQHNAPRARQLLFPKKMPSLGASLPVVLESLLYVSRRAAVAV